MRPDLEPSEAFAEGLRAAEERLRSSGLHGRRAFHVLCRHLARSVGVPEELWPLAPDAPPAARLDALPLASDIDMFGLAYERFFGDLFKGEKGQYFTPRPVVELMVDMAGIRPGERVLDPTCGSGGFLVTAHNRGGDVDGIEVDPDLVHLAQVNLAMHGANPRGIERADLFQSPVEDRYDVILANPPFSMEIQDQAVLGRFELGRGKPRVTSDILFMEAAWQRLRPAGRLVTVLPWSVLANGKYERLRVWMARHFNRRMVVSLPEGVFLPFGGTPTRACILSLVKTPAPAQPSFVARITTPGFDTRRRRFIRRDRDDLTALRIHLTGGRRYRDVAEVSPTADWVPEDILADSGLGDDVPVQPLEALAQFVSPRVVPRRTPAEIFTEVDLADVDKETGEVHRARARAGESFPPKQQKTEFQAGDILFGRMRPQLNNVCVVSKPEGGLPDVFVGSSEWLKLEPKVPSYFLLLALRSRFVREQLGVTGGQTRPRVQADRVANVKVPVPSETVQEQASALLASLHAERQRLRHLLVSVDRAYEAFGTGQLSEIELSERLQTLQDAMRDPNEPSAD